MDYSGMTLVEISKATEKKIPSDKKMKKKGYRLSRLERFNPRSKTYVKEGTALNRLGGPLAGTALGSMAGGVVDAAARGRTMGLGAATGAALGATAGYNRNVKSGDTVSYERATGAKAKTKVNIPVLGTYNAY